MNVSHPIFFDSFKETDDFSSKMLCFKNQPCTEAVWDPLGRIGGTYISIKSKKQNNLHSRSTSSLTWVTRNFASSVRQK